MRRRQCRGPRGSGCGLAGTLGRPCTSSPSPDHPWNDGANPVGKDVGPCPALQEAGTGVTSLPAQRGRLRGLGEKWAACWAPAFPGPLASRSLATPGLGVQ